MRIRTGEEECRDLINSFGSDFAYLYSKVTDQVVHTLRIFTSFR